MSHKYLMGLRSIKEHKELLKKVPMVSKKKFEELALTIIARGNFEHIKVLAGLAGNPYKPFDVVDNSNGEMKVLFRVPAILGVRSGKPFMNEQSLQKLFAIKGDGVQQIAARRDILNSIVANKSDKFNVIDELEKWTPIAKYYKIPIFNGLIDAQGNIVGAKKENKVVSDEGETLDSFDLDKYL